MGKKSKSRYYDPVFIKEAVKLALGKEKPVSQIASDLGIPVATLHTWVAKAKAGKLKSSSERQRKADGGNDNRKIAELEKQNRLLRMERDILKKAMAFFIDVPK